MHAALHGPIEAPHVAAIILASMAIFLLLKK
jgi:hypothetical protein